MTQNITPGQIVTMTNRRGETMTAKVLLVHPESVFPQGKARVEFIDGHMRGEVMDFAISRMTPVAGA
jgi:hypothetical protein